VGDHLAREDRLGADVVGDRGEDCRVLCEVERAPGQPARVRRAAEVRHHVHRVGGGAAVADREQPPSRLEIATQPRGGGEQLVAILLERLSPQLRHLPRLREDRAAHVVDDGLEVLLPLGEERVEEAGRSGVVHAALVAALQQPAVVEEDVHQLPEHVVERLDELLPHRGVLARGLELPLRAAARREAQRQAAALAGKLQRALGVGAEADHDVAGLEHQPRLLDQRPALARERERRQRALAHDHGVHELDRHVPSVRARRRRAPEGDQAPAAGEALRHPVTYPREPLGLRLEEGPVRLRALGERALEDVAPERVGQAGASTREPTRASQSRHSSTPSPVFALTVMRSTPGWTASRL
jgi:hypothetical protein